MPRFASREEIRDHQLAELRPLLAEVGRNNPFYGPQICEAGFDRGVDDLEQFVQRMPTTTKQKIIDDQQQNPPYGTNLTYPLRRYTRFNQTSATSGAPLRWLDTPESWQWMVDNWRQVYRAAGVRPEDCVYFAFSFGPFLGFWTAFDAATQLGCRSIPGGGLSSAGRLTAMRDNHATVLCCTPTYAMRLAEVAHRERIDLAEFNVRRIIVAGEPGGSVPTIRESIEQQWPKAGVFDHYGMTEVGPVSYECPEKPGSLVVIESSYLAEILEPESLRPVERGEVGELVLTTLGRFGSPLIRYRTGDLVREDTALQDQFGIVELALEGGIVCRADDMVVVRGVNVYPSAVADVCAAFPEIAEYRVRVRRGTAMVEMLLDVEPADDTIDQHLLAQRIRTRLESCLSLTIPIEILPPGTLPRYEMKSRRWVSVPAES